MKIFIVDDDPVNNFICKVTIKNVSQDAQIATYENPQLALDFIKSNFTNYTFENTVLLLDINMPELSGWEFLTELEQAAPDVLNQFQIYILSSSVDQRDIQKAQQTPYIVDFISKPLRKEHVLEMFKSN